MEKGQERPWKASFNCSHCAIAIHFSMEVGGGRTYAAVLNFKGKPRNRVGQRWNIKELGCTYATMLNSKGKPRNRVVQRWNIKELG